MFIPGRKSLISFAGLFTFLFVGFSSNKPVEFSSYQQDIPGTNLNFGMVPIPEGTFKMGSHPSQKGFQNMEIPQHTVKIDAFWM